MKFKDIIFSNAKKIVGASLLLVLMGVQTVGASGEIKDSIKSKGNIEYDSTGDGAADVLFYSKDLTVIADGIDDLNTNVATLNTAMSELKDTTSGYKADIIAGLNSNVYAKSNIDSSATFEDIINKINNIPAPTTAVGSYYTSGDNSGLGIGTSSGTNVNIDGVTSLNLAVNEAITLPSGYYPNDITIKNNVANRGSLSFNPSGKSRISIAAGYYTSGVLDSTAAYNKGYADGYEQKPTGSISYNIGHKHYGESGTTSANGCYTKAYQSYEVVDTKPGYYTYGVRESKAHSYVDIDQNGWCDTCWGKHTWHAARDVYDYVTRYELGCGKEEKEYVRTTSSLSLAENEQLLSATIVY